MTRNKIILILLAVFALGAGWYFGSPRWTLWQMGRAAEARDSDRLAAYIDFPKLRETSKAQLKAQMAAEVQKQGQAGGFGALGAMIGMAMIDPIVDSALTPQAMRVAFEKAPEKGKSGARGGAEGAEGAGSAASGAGAAGGAPAAAGGGKKGPLGIDTEDVEIVHNGVHEFRLRQKGGKGEDGDLIFRRHGLGWKLEEIRVPADLMRGGPR